MAKAEKTLRYARYAVSAIFFADGATLAGYIAHLADIQVRLHLTNSALGQALLFSALGAISGMPLSGALIHRFGSRRLTPIAGIFLLLVAPWVVLAPTVPLLRLTLFFIGASNGLCDVSMNAHSMAVQDRFDRPILSAIHGWFSIGGFAGAAVAATFARLNLTPFVHMSAASILLAGVLGVGIAWMLPWDCDKDADGPRFALPTGRILFLGVLMLFAFVSEGAMWDWSAVYLRRVLHSSPAVGALGFGLAGFGMAAGRILGDDWTHRMGYRKLLLSSSIVAGGGLLFAVNAGSVTCSILGFVIMGVGLANSIPILFRAAASQPGISAGAGLAAVTTCGYAGFLGGPPIVGYIADQRTLGFSLGLIATLCLVIAICSKEAVGRLEKP
jgi:MFS family permease